MLSVGERGRWSSGSWSAEVDDEDAISIGSGDVGDRGMGWRAYETASAAQKCYIKYEECRRVQVTLTIRGASNARHHALAADESCGGHGETK